jgi:formylglycine-generating enzyme required for sulfatase activity
MRWPWGAVLIVAVAAGSAAAGWRVAVDPHGAFADARPRGACEACHLPTHPADVASLDQRTCPECHMAARASEDTRVLPPIDDSARRGSAADKPLAVTGEMVQIPAGPFVMGYDKRHPDEGPMHTRARPSVLMD